MHDHTHPAGPIAIPSVEVPIALVIDPAISTKAKAVYFVLRMYGDDAEDCYPDRATIAEHLGAKRGSVTRWVAELEAAGWIERVERHRSDGGQTSNGYRVLDEAQA